MLAVTAQLKHKIKIWNQNPPLHQLAVFYSIFYLEHSPLPLGPGSALMTRRCIWWNGSESRHSERGKKDGTTPLLHTCVIVVWQCRRRTFFHPQHSITPGPFSATAGTVSIGRLWPASSALVSRVDGTPLSVLSAKKLPSRRAYRCEPAWLPGGILGCIILASPDRRWARNRCRGLALLGGG